MKIDLLNDEKLASKVFYGMESGVYWKDLNGFYFGCNKKMLSMLGLDSQQQIKGRSDGELWGYPAETVAKWEENDRLVLSNGKADSNELRPCAGKNLTLLISKYRLIDEAENVVGIIGFCQETSLKKSVRPHNFLDNNLNLEEIAGLIDTGIYWKDKRGRYLGCNHSFVKMMGLQHTNQLIGKSDSELLWKASAGHLREVDRFVLENGTRMSLEELESPNGSLATYLSVKKQMLDDFNNVMGLIGTIVDLSTLKERPKFTSATEPEKEKKDKKLIKKILHDIDSPLTAVTIILSSLESIPDELRHTLKIALTRIGNASKELCAFSMRHDDEQCLPVISVEPVLASVQLHTVLVEKKAQYRNRKISINSIVDKNARFSFVHVNNLAWRQILAELIDNAVDAIGSQAGQIQVELKVERGEVVLLVADSGVGMSHFIQARAMQGGSFESISAPGRRFGLANVHRILKSFNGTMLIDSAPNCGARIRIKFAEANALRGATDELKFRSDQILLALDTDNGTDNNWNVFLEKIQERNPRVKLLRFSTEQQVYDYLMTLSVADSHRTQVLVAEDKQRDDEVIVRRNAGKVGSLDKKSNHHFPVNAS